MGRKRYDLTDSVKDFKRGKITLACAIEEILEGCDPTIFSVGDPDAIKVLNTIKEVVEKQREFEWKTGLK